MILQIRYQELEPVADNYYRPSDFVHQQKPRTQRLPNQAMDFSKVPKAKPISAKKAAQYNKIFDDPQKMKEIFEQCEASGRWAAGGCRVDGRGASMYRGTKPEGIVEKEEKEEEEEEEEEEELIASKYFKKGAGTKLKEPEKKMEKFGAGERISNLLVLRNEEEGSVLSTKNTTTPRTPTAESGTKNT